MDEINNSSVGQAGRGGLIGGAGPPPPYNHRGNTANAP